MNDSIAVVVAKIGKRATGSQFGEAKPTTLAANSSLCTRHEAHRRGPKKLTH
jgi:hypothetical protein